MRLAVDRDARTAASDPVGALRDELADGLYVTQAVAPEVRVTEQGIAAPVVTPRAPRPRQG